MHDNKKIGLVLSGGGARGAYQAGVLLALAELRNQLTKETYPIRIVTGVSAGAINAAYFASQYPSELATAKRLVHIWRNLTTDKVFRTDAISLSRIGLSWLRDTALGSLSADKKAHALLDTTPLRQLLSDGLDWRQIEENLQSGLFNAFSVAALNYATAHCISFVMGNGKQATPSWKRSRRRSLETNIKVEHILASSAIPLFFAPVQVGDEYYGDGCLRNTAPLSSAIHLGADKLLVVGVRRPEEKARHVAETNEEPSVARVLGVVINALLMDAIEFDMERLDRINNTLHHIPKDAKNELALRPIEALWIRPSEDLGYLASEKHKNLPKTMRYLLGGLGSSRDASDLTSYLLFDPDYCGTLIDLGYRDTWAMKDELISFFTDTATEALSSEPEQESVSSAVSAYSRGKTS